MASKPNVVSANMKTTTLTVQHVCTYHMDSILIIPCVFANSHLFLLSFGVFFALRALNEMWKCQNMLRSLVKELLDLHKLPVVC